MSANRYTRGRRANGGNYIIERTLKTAREWSADGHLDEIAVAYARGRIGVAEMHLDADREVAAAARDELERLLADAKKVAA